MTDTKLNPITSKRRIKMDKEKIEVPEEENEEPKNAKVRGDPKVSVW